MSANNILIAFCVVIGSFDIILASGLLKIIKKVNKPFYILFECGEIQNKVYQILFAVIYVIIYILNKRIGNFNCIKDELFFVSIVLLLLWYILSSKFSIILHLGIIRGKTYYDATEISYCVEDNCINFFNKDIHCVKLRLPKNLRNDVLHILNDYYHKKEF